MQTLIDVNTVSTRALQLVYGTEQQAPGETGQHMLLCIQQSN